MKFIFLIRVEKRKFNLFIGWDLNFPFVNKSFLIASKRLF